MTHLAVLAVRAANKFHSEFRSRIKLDRYIGSLRSPAKRALMEMVRFGAIVRHNSIWFSCNAAQFYDMTVAALAHKQLIIISVNSRVAGKQFARLTPDGIDLAKACLAEHDARALACRLLAEQAFAAADLTAAESMPA